jgi:peptidyl-prolyl cis-trans isomerase C
MSRRTAAAAVAALFFASGPLAAQTEGAADTAPAETAMADPATVVATVDGTEITLGHMIALRGTLPAQYRDLPDDVLFDGILDQLIQQTALAAVGETDITPLEALELENHRRGYLAGSVLDRAAEAAVTDEALQRLYDEKYANAAPSSEYNAAHILVATEDEAKAIKADIDGGGDFAALAKEKSMDPGSAANGGELGWFGLGMMVKEFEDSVIRLQPGNVSDPVETQFGWHIIKLIETRAAAAPALADVRDELAAELQQKAIEAKVEELTAAAKIERPGAGLAPSVLKDAVLSGE